MKKILTNYFTRIYIIKAFVVACCLSAFIYLAYFDITIKLLNTLLAGAGFYLLLGENRYVYFWSGLFIGIMWFYWISFSFVYYELAFLIPLVILGVALCYALLFWVIGRVSSYRIAHALMLTLLCFIVPFDFNWFKPELIFIDSFVNTTWWAFGLFVIAIAILKLPAKKIRFLALIPFVLSLNYSTPSVSTPKLNVMLPETNVPQSQRWDKAYQSAAIDQNFALIEKAIQDNYDVIVLPESAFPMYLNLAPALEEKLKEYSEKIAIVAGALTYEKEVGFYNSSYFFNHGEMNVAHKIILVPFGEEIPFPSFVVNIVNKLFFDGAEDYKRAKEPQDFVVNDLTFRSAICFEATRDELYRGAPKYMFAISNNAWFSPSIEQTLQHLLLRLYAKKYQTVIYHSANSGKSGVILP